MHTSALADMGRRIPIRTAAAIALSLVVGGASGAPAPSKPGEVFRVPYHLTATQHLLVRARVNDSAPLNLVVDTGAPALFLAPQFAEKAGVKPGTDHWGTVESLEIEGRARLSAVPARVQELPQLQGMNHLAAAGTRLDGVLGYGVLARFRIQIDLREPHLTWTLLDWTPPEFQPVQMMEEAEPPAAAKEAMAKMEALPKLLNTLMPRRVETPPVERGFLGVELPANPKPSSLGVPISRVVAGSPAAKSLRAGDRIASVRVAGRPSAATSTPAALLKALEGVPAGTDVGLRVRRGGRVRLVSVQLTRSAL